MARFQFLVFHSTLATMSHTGQESYNLSRLEVGLHLYMCIGTAQKILRSRLLCDFVANAFVRFDFTAEMFFSDSFVFDVIVFFVVYKLLDRLIRIPRIGNYSDRYILVTGCDTGFGNLLAKRLDQLGCHVFAGCLTEKGETELKKVSSERLHVISLDVANQESVRKALENVKSKLPPGRCKIAPCTTMFRFNFLSPPSKLPTYTHTPIFVRIHSAFTYW